MLERVKANVPLSPCFRRLRPGVRGIETILWDRARHVDLIVGDQNMQSGDERRSGGDRRVADRREHDRIGEGFSDRRKAQRRDGSERRQKDAS